MAFRYFAAAALALHALVLFGTPGLHGGADLILHLSAVLQMEQGFDLRVVYAPFFHFLGGVVAPWVGLALYAKLFAFSAIAASLASFRFFQRAAGLPEATSILYAIWPYGFVWSWALPKIEAAGFAVLFLALGLLIRRRYLALAAAQAACFYVHPHAAYLLGFCGGVLALARRDPRALGALAGGVVGALPLFAAHLADGCSLAQALYLSPGAMLAVTDRLAASRERLGLVLVLAHPVLLGAALLGARPLWERHRALAVLCGATTLLYLNEFWLPLTGIALRTGLAPDRGLALLALPVTASAGVFLAARPRLAPAFLGVAGLWTLLTVFTATPRLLAVRPFSEAVSFRDVRLERCVFRWRAPHVRREGWGTVRPLRGVVSKEEPK